MHRVLKSQEQTFKDDYKLAWTIDMQFLHDHARDMGVNIIKDKFMCRLPTLQNEGTITLKQLPERLAILKEDRLAIACGSDLTDDIDGLYTCVTSIVAGRGPSEQAVQAMSKWERQVLLRCEFYLVEPVADEQSGMIKTVVGRDAMQVLWTRFQKTPVDARTLKQVAPFRQYCWMMQQSQWLEVEKLRNLGISKYQALLLQPMLKDSEEPILKDEVNALVPMGSGARSSSDPSSSSSSSVAGLSHAGTLEKKSKADSSADSAQAQLLQMFKMRKS